MAIESKILSATATTPDDLAFAQALGFKPGDAPPVDLDDEPTLPFGFEPVPLPSAAPVFKNPMANEFIPTPSDNAQKLSDALSSKKLPAAETPVVADEDRDFLAAARATLPAEPWDASTWKAWTEAVKTATGRKGKPLFMPLRLALTGLDHGPELAALLPLIGRNRVLDRLA